MWLWTDNKGSVVKFLCFGHIIKKDWGDPISPRAFLGKVSNNYCLFWWPSLLWSSQGWCRSSAILLPSRRSYAVPLRQDIFQRLPNIFHRPANPDSAQTWCQPLSRQGGPHLHLLNNALLRRPEKVRPAFDNAPQSAYLSTSPSLE